MAATRVPGDGCECDLGALSAAFRAMREVPETVDHHVVRGTWPGERWRQVLRRVVADIDAMIVEGSCDMHAPLWKAGTP